jgi:hypothetical protein
MDSFIGILLVLAMMTLIFLGPQWVVKLTRKPKRYRRRVRLAVDSQTGRIAGRRRNNRPGANQSPSRASFRRLRSPFTPTGSRWIMSDLTQEKADAS